MRQDIVVADDEIAVAKRGLNTRCAIAAAIMNQVPAARYIKVNKKTISYLDADRGLRYVFRTPPAAASFIDRWDRGEKVTPIGFSLTESTLVSCRPKKQVSTKERVKRATPKPVKQPGSRMTRNPDQPCAVS